jgi:hypothetical protein
MPGYNSQDGARTALNVVWLLFVLFYVVFVRKCVLPPGDNPIAVNKYIISYIISYDVLFCGTSIQPNWKCCFVLHYSRNITLGKICGKSVTFRNLKEYDCITKL